MGAAIARSFGVRNRRLANDSTTVKESLAAGVWTPVGYGAPDGVPHSEYLRESNGSRYTGDMYDPLPRSFYLRPTVEVAQNLIGTHLCRRLSDGTRLTGIVVETEAYVTDDPASHSYTGRTERNAAMFGPPGHAYIYLSYGIHQMLNAVCAAEGIGEAVLIRAVEPVEGIDSMRANRVRVSPPPLASPAGGAEDLRELTNGPGRLAAAFQVHRSRDNEADLTKTNSGLWISGRTRDWEIGISTRIGITRGTKHPWRYYARGNRYVSKGKPSVALG